MIQIVPSHLQPNTSATFQDSQNTAPAGWGKWWANRHYELEIAQHPLRARMCGFGDKDRRPIAPATVAKMTVRNKDNSLVDLEQIDPTFFIVTVDLWSEDGTKEMNLVLHPSSSADRHPPGHAPKQRRRATNSQSTHQSPTVTPEVLPNTSQYRGRPSETPSITATPLAAPAYPFTTQQAQQAQPMAPLGYNPSTPYSQPSAPPSMWTFGSQVPDRPAMPYSSDVLPSINSMSRNAAAAATGGSVSMVDPWSASSSSSGYRPWAPQDSSLSSSPQQPLGDTEFSTLRASHPFSPPTLPSETRDSNMYFNQPSYSPSTAPNYDASPLGGYSTQTPLYPHPSSVGASSTQTAAPAPTPAAATDIPPLPRHTYTRTLVGPLSANATRLLDEHRKPGVFFLFQDLSVRTEGTFRLRLRLMNIGPPTLQGMPYEVNTGVVGILAQTFTEPFVVYSAKRFPGVPDTTALSIAFGNQGQKLPLRSKNGESKGRRRRRNESDSGSDDDD